MEHRFGWYELYTTDPVAAQKFYGEVIGWTIQKWEHADYTMWVAPSGPVGGVMLLPEQAKAMGAPPHWMGYVGVANAADIATMVESLGGQVHVPPTDLPNGARFAIFADPQGASFAVHQAAASGDAGGMPSGKGLGEFSWAELYTSDLEAGFAFYNKLFGWEKQDAMDMGEMGPYLIFGLPASEGKDKEMLGGMMRRPPGMPVSAWTHYANVADADLVAEKVKRLGGTIMNGPMEVPGGGRIVMATDPQGAVFAVFAPKK